MKRTSLRIITRNCKNKMSNLLNPSNKDSMASGSSSRENRILTNWKKSKMYYNPNQHQRQAKTKSKLLHFKYKNQSKTLILIIRMTKKSAS